mmetsp:Transcript_37777/g.68851  ORF Transcript_37777/g.68851 Transcript_37777/m.68851 type:complete len:292 (-) Transcript_37777:53-928(-)
MATSSIDGKLVYFIRHGQADHNVGIEQKALTGSEAFQELACKHHDARLTPLGINQAKAVNALFAQGTLPMPEVVIASTQSRALGTALAAFSNFNVPIVASDLWRERCGTWLCEHRRVRSALAEDFPAVDFSEVTSEPDALWSELRETRKAVDERAKAATAGLLSRAETVIAVVSHSLFLASCVLSRQNQALADVSAELQGPFGNAEVRVANLRLDGLDQRGILRWHSTIPNRAAIDQRQREDYEQHGRQNTRALHDFLSANDLKVLLQSFHRERAAAIAADETRRDMAARL